eukprot:1586252-Pyramimonas_sp.AAC.1
MCIRDRSWASLVPGAPHAHLSEAPGGFWKSVEGAVRWRVYTRGVVPRVCFGSSTSCAGCWSRLVTGPLEALEIPRMHAFLSGLTWATARSTCNVTRLSSATTSRTRHVLLSKMLLSWAVQSARRPWLPGNRTSGVL